MSRRAIIVTGSRYALDPEDRMMIRQRLDNAVALCQPVLFVGCADGVDEVARDHAAEFGIETRVFKAEWKKLGNSAGPIRNAQMARAFHAFLYKHPEADYRAFAFPGPHSTGTWNCLRRIVALGHEVAVKGVRT